jgi:hypothetical protein
VNITQPVFREWKIQLPFIQPCYSVGDASSREIISVMRENRIPMICANPRDVSVVNDYSLVIENNRFGTNEYIARNMKDLDSPAASPRAPAASPRAPATSPRAPATSPRAPAASPPLWVHTTISSEGIVQTREMFEYIWAHKLVLNGIVFNTRNFADKNAVLMPSMYSYKIAFDYLFRNMIIPFKKEYGIHTPCIMIDGRDHITRVEHLHGLRHSAFESDTSSSSSVIHSCKEYGIELRLIVDSLIDRTPYAPTTLS